MTAQPPVTHMFTTLLALILTVLSAALAAGAEQPATIPTIGWLVFEAGEGGLDGFRQGLRALGYVEGQNIAIEARSPEESDDRLVEQVEDLARLKVKIIVTGGVPATLAAKRAALPIPVVFIMADPVGSGVVSSLARPGGNMTGQSLAIEEQFSGKWLELLKEAAPQLSRITYLWNPANHSSASSWKAMQGLAPTLGLTLQSIELRDPPKTSARLLLRSFEIVPRGSSSIRIPSTASTKRGSSSLPPQIACRPSTSGGGMSTPVG